MIEENKNEILTAEDLSRLFSVPVRTIVRMAKDGKIPSLKVGGKWRFHRELIEKWMKGSATQKLRKKLLVIEDDESDRNTMVKALGKFDVKVEEADTVEDAIEILKKGFFDGVILDIYFKEGQKGGFDFLEWLDRSNINIPVIIYTAHDDPETILKVLNYGGFFILSKPLIIERLQKALETIFKFGGN